MTILGKHTVAETRDLIKATEFRVTKVLNQLQLVQSNRRGAFSSEQMNLDRDATIFFKRWVDVRDRQTLLLAASVLSNPNVHPAIIPAEPNWQAILKVIQIDEPRLGTIQQRVLVEGNNIGLPPVDLSEQPGQNSPDVDFAALQKLDAAIASAEASAAAAGEKAKGAAKSNIGLVIGLGAVGVAGVVVLTKVYL